MKRMKKLLLVFGLMGIIVFSHAAKAAENYKPGSCQSFLVYEQADQLHQGDMEVNEAACTVTQEAKVTIYFVEYKISCTTTASTCKEATVEAVGCVNQGIALLRQHFK
jgi:hypothetical protein